MNPRISSAPAVVVSCAFCFFWVDLTASINYNHQRGNRIFHRPDTRTTRTGPGASIFGTMDWVWTRTRHVVAVLRTTGNGGPRKMGRQTGVDFMAFFKRTYASVRVSLLLPGFLTTIGRLVTYAITCFSVEYARMS